MGIKSLQVTPDGGMFPLVSKGGEEEDKPVIQLHVPQGAVRAAGKGMVEVRYRPIPDIVVAPVTRHLVSLVGMLVGKKVKMATATNGGLNLPAANTATDSLESDNHSTSGLREAISSPCDVSVYGKCFQMHA